ncbi:hypothetical protein SISSUDRAFT_1068181 [Sistotremastrum suecicum HHB10207 ss-3]|uniref:Uncharacterized protein n=1 Tax=Sistotremastrum suecicum HHB10207 ss-3 TaxID=1314776 RepID=A0A165WE60_9AGAM|nr:hypothetical protein SISSUDRAFT_1068181 [Sistotremastrum suecicum HHB10207 ss-3]
MTALEHLGLNWSIPGHALGLAAAFWAWHPGYGHQGGPVPHPGLQYLSICQYTLVHVLNTCPSCLLEPVAVLLFLGISARQSTDQVMGGE